MGKARITNKADHEYAVLGVTLAIGVTLLGMEQWDKIREHPGVKRRECLGLLEVAYEDEAPQAATPEGGDAQLENPFEGKTVAEAVKVIAELDDLEVLRALQQLDDRKGVQAALADRIQALEEGAQS